MIPDGILGVVVLGIIGTLFVDAPTRTVILALFYWGVLP